MKVLLVNGSPRKGGKGNTNVALEAVAEALNDEGIETEIFWIGTSVAGCMGCEGCNKKGECVIDDKVNEFRKLAFEADGFVFGAPVHYAHAGSNMLAFLDRLFYSSGRAGNENPFTHKPGAAVAVARRGGASAALDDLNKFMTITQMPIVSSYYWNMVYGRKPGEAEQDAEGISTMKQLGHNMVWMLKCLEAGKAAGIEPVDEPRAWTHFIR